MTRHNAPISNNSENIKSLPTTCGLTVDAVLRFPLYAVGLAQRLQLLPHVPLHRLAPALSVNFSKSPAFSIVLPLSSGNASFFGPIYAIAVHFIVSE